MDTSTKKCINWFKEFYSHEFPELSREFKNEKIEDIMYHNAKYITREEVIEFDACSRCGRCCRAQRCLDFDEETNLCTRHDDPISQFCIDYPWTGEDFGIAPLLLNCDYIRKFFVHFFDNYFQDIINEGEENASRSD
jgi:hypothetical protein